MSTRRSPDQRAVAFDIVADATRTGPTIVACTSRAVRRQYRAAVARRGGVAANIVFSIMPDMPDNFADVMRRRTAGRNVNVLDVRELAPLPRRFGRG